MLKPPLYISRWHLRGLIQWDIQTRYDQMVASRGIDFAMGYFFAETGVFIESDPNHDRRSAHNVILQLKQ